MRDFDRAKLKPEIWREAVDRLFQSEYAVTLNDIGADAAVLQETWSGGTTPAEYVRWFGRKYDLMSRDEWRDQPLKIVSR